MSDDLRQIRERLRALLERATPGPWAEVRSGWIIGGNGMRICVIPDRLDEQDVADADLIAAMRTALPMLLDRADEADRLREALQRARNTLAGLGYGGIARDICDAALTPATTDTGPTIAMECLPKTVGRVHLGERLSDGERLCSHGHAVPAGHPLYWPERLGEYPDDIDPLCLAHAIEQTESDQDWCERCIAADLAAESATDTGPTSWAGKDDGGEAITAAARRMVAAQGMDWAELDGGDIGYWESLAAEALNQATLTATQDAGAGMVLVPREPTAAMARAGGLAFNADPDVLAVTAHEARVAWSAMLAAAHPAASETGEGA